LLLGYLNPNYFLGGRLKLDVAAAQRALETHIAKPLGLNILDAAWGIHKIVNESMANAMKTCVAERGGNIYRATMVGFGGAGPVHAAQLARTLKIPTLIIPPFAGVASALGFMLAPFAYDVVRTHKIPLDDLDVPRVRALLDEMAVEASSVVKEAQTSGTARIDSSAELCFIGQGYPVTISLGEFGEGPLDVSRIRVLFLSAYRKRFGHCLDDAPVELVSLRVSASIAPKPLNNLYVSPKASPSDAWKGRREAYDETFGGLATHAVYDRYAMPVDMLITGPALIEERETTTVVPSQASAIVRDDGAIVINFKELSS